MSLKMKSVLVFVLLALTATAQADVDPKKDWSFKEAGLIPVQSGGRIKPLDSFAREIVLFETGSRHFAGWHPVDLALSWIAHPAEWRNKQFIQVVRPDVRRQLGLDESRSRFSPDELFKNPTVAQYAERAGQTVEKPDPKGGMRMNPREQELKRVFDRLGLYHSMVSGHAWLVVPQPAPQQWVGLAGQDKEGQEIRKSFIKLLYAYQAADQAKFIEASAEVKNAIQQKVSGWNQAQERVLTAESTYNRFRPFYYAWIVFLVAAITWIFALRASENKILRTVSLLLTGAGALLLIGGIALRCYIAGRPPVSNMYESVIWVALGTTVFGSIIYVVKKQGLVLAVACFVSMFTLIAADSAPAILDPSIQPLVPVLRSNFWLTIHVLTITLGYAAFALTLGIANVTLYHFLTNKPGSMAKIANTNDLTYRAMQFGVVLLAAGTILGGVWADYSWGRFWGWDPKEVWALIALLCYLAILHGRFTQWVGQFGYAAWTVVAFLSVVMAWYGVNFVLGVGLHSYGFATGGRGWVAAFVALQLSYVGLVALVRASRKKQVSSAGAT